MPEGEIEIAYCHACGNSMDVGAVAPFSNVECPACGKHTRVKREFGPYTLLRRHAIGGMSVVFIAQDNTLGREVVVKILNEEYGSDEKRISAFEEEARITASFSHPHVVRVFTTGRAFSRFYIAMELVPGGHFEHHIRERGSIPEKEVLPLAHQVGAGLKAAHAAGLIHRDIKPGNILLDAGGNAKIVDFGLALVTKGGKAQATEIWATPYYVPPETIEGLPEDFRSDVYAFGATLYHALAGKPPCNEESMDTNRLRDAKKKIPPLAKAAPWVSADTCAVVDRAMAHDPQQRFRSYDDLLSALETARQRLASQPVNPGPAKKGAAKVAARTSSNAGEKLALAGASLLVVGALVFGGWWVMQPVQPVVPQGGLPVVGPPPQIPAISGGDSERAGPVYREAGEALRAGDFEKARRLFVEVRDLPGVLQPTGSWAACEAVICSYLDGKPGEARKDARAASQHVQAATGVDGGLRSVLLDGLEKLSEFKSHPLPDDAAPASGPGLLAALLGGLKHWEQGLPEVAQGYFAAVLANGAQGADAWVSPYQPIVRNYQEDARKLAALDPGKLPDSAAACRDLVKQLADAEGGLKTKGRARFNVQSLRRDLETRARMLDSQKTPEPVPANDGDILATVRKQAASCQFSEASALIKSPGFLEKSGKEMTSAILLLTEAAAAFLGDLEDDLVKTPANLILQLRDKTPTGTITGSRSGGVTVLDPSGSPRVILWAELSPDSLIELHRQLVKDEASETERLRRHEQAIAFDLLAGDPSRAKEAANVLAARYPAFKRRWDLVQPALE
jgi:hypothetical protein